MRTAATALLLALFLGCSKEPSSSPSSSSSPSQQTMWSIRASKGGDASGAQVTFPPDAVRDNFDVALASSEGDTHASPGVRVAGKVWSVRVDNKEHFTFEKPVSVRFPRILDIEKKLEDEVKKDLGLLWAIGDE